VPAARSHRALVGGRKALSTALLALLVLQGAGCAVATQSWRAGPAGIPAERRLRDHLAWGQYEAAWEALGRKQVAPADALLRHMYKGVVALHAGEYERGARAMDRAWTLAYERWTKRAGDAALSMVTSDAALPYTPGPAERMFIPYYGALTWLARNERASAAVEARRLSTLLESDDGPQPADEFRGVMRYVAGVMHEMAGERNDADVSYRNAALLLGALPGDTLPPDGDHGDVVVLIEEGFVGRPEPAGMTFWFNDDELGHLRGDDESVRIATVGALSRRRHDERDWSAARYRAVSITWPTFSGEPHDRFALGARAGGLAVPVATADVTASVRADFDRRQPARLARAIARAAIRDAAIDAAGKSFENAAKAGDDEDDDEDDKKGGTAKAIGHVLLGIGLLATGATSAVLDQPDLRAWQILPDRIGVARLRLPAGDHEVEVMRGDEAVSLGVVRVRPGGVTLVTHRWWPAARGARTLVEGGGELPDHLSRGPDVVDPGHRSPRLPVLPARVIAQQ
jgi:hypothetical protein